MAKFIVVLDNEVERNVEADGYTKSSMDDYASREGDNRFLSFFRQESKPSGTSVLVNKVTVAEFLVDHVVSVERVED